MIDGDEGFWRGAETSGGVGVFGGDEAYGGDEELDGGEAFDSDENYSAPTGCSAATKPSGSAKAFGRRRGLRTAAQLSGGGEFFAAVMGRKGDETGGWNAPDRKSTRLNSSHRL